jgi:hypothetical protein
VRFLLPRRRRSADAVLRHFRSDATRGARLRIRALRGALWVGRGWPLAREQLGVTWPPSGPPDTIETHLHEVLGQKVTLGVQLGPPRANRKPILQVLDAADRPMAFGKLGIDDLTRRLVLAEGAALMTLSGLSMPGIARPELIHRGSWNNAELLVVSALPLSKTRHGVPESKLVEAMRTVARSTGCHSVRPGRTAHMLALRERASGLRHPDIRGRTITAIDSLLASERPWTLGAWHGDWTVWNQASHGDQVLLWDWERFASGVPVGWDALHFALRQELVGREPTPEVARHLLSRAEVLLQPFDVDPQVARAVAVAYLIELAVRYTADGQREAGGRTARVEEWILPALGSPSSC